MRFKRFIEMAMMTGQHLPDDVILVKKVFAGGSGCIIFYADYETHQQVEEDSGYSYPSKPNGSIDLHRGRDGVWLMGQVYAAHGWGPMLYELAIEHATTNGKGLIADPREMSPDAIGVFTKYIHRTDVQKTPLPDVPPQWKDHPELHFIYSIPGEPMTKEMVADEQLVVG